MQSYLAQLTPSQAAFLQTLLPKGYSMQMATLDSKRQRPAKKLDEAFIADYSIDTKRIINRQSSQSSNQKLESSLDIEAVRPVIKKTSSIKQQPNKESPCKNGKINHTLNKENLLRMLADLKNCKHSWPFRVPVDPVAYGVPHYPEIVKHPMDLSTIQTKLAEGKYDSDDEFHQDVSLIISNSYLFNPKETIFYAVTQKFEAFYHKLCQNKEKLIESGQKRNHQKNLEPIKNTADLIASHPTKATLTIAEKMTTKERQNLFHKIYQLPQSDIIKLINIVDPGNLPENWRQFEFDFKDIDDTTYKKIATLVNKEGRQYQ